MGAFSTYSTDQQRSEAEALNSDQTFSVVSKDDDKAVVSEDKAPCSLYLMGQCTVEGCEFDHPGEKVTTQAALRPSSSSKPPATPTYPGSPSLDAQDTSNWTDQDDQDKGDAEVRQDSRNDEHRARSSASKSAITLEPSSSPSQSVLQAPLTTCASTQCSEQILTSELQHYPHISQVMLHWSQFADPLARAELAFCKLHAQGKCTRAESCTFRHSLTVEEYSSLFRDPQPTLVTLRREGGPIVAKAITTIQPVIPPTVVHPASLSLQTCHTPSVSPIISNMASEQKYFSKQCSFFRSGNCRNGGHCPYAHVQTPSPPEITIESNEDDNWSPIPTQTERINKPCKFFNSTYGYCRSGSECPFLHQADGPSGPPSTSEDQMGRSVNGDNKEHDNGWGRDWGENDQQANTTDDAYNHGEPEDDQGINEWTTPQGTSSWERATHEERLEYRNGQSSGTFPQSRSQSRPCYHFNEGTCRRGTSCKFAHDNEPTGSRYRNATRNFQTTYVSQSSTRQEPLSTSSMTPDFAGTPEFETGENGTAKEEPEENPPFFLSPQTGDDNDDDNGWNATWAPTEEPTNLPRVKSKEYCLAYGQGHCGKGDTCQFRHADPSAPLSKQTTSPPPSYRDAPENESFSSAGTVSASTNVPHEPEELPLVSNISDHPEVEKLVMNATVSFRPDFVPVSIEPLAESHELQFSNLPSDITTEDVQTLVEPYGIVLENTLRTSQRTASVRVDFATAKQARNAFEYLQLQEYSRGDRKFVASFANVKLRLSPADKDTLKLSWPKPTLVGWSHYPTIGKAKEDAARLNGVIVKGRKIQVEFCSPSKRQKDNFAIKISNLSLETTKDEIEQLCKSHMLTTGFDKPTYLETHASTSREMIKEEFHSFGELAFERISDSECDEGPNSHLLVVFPCEAIAQEVVKEFSSRKLSCIGHQSLEIKPVYFAQYCVSWQIFDVVRQEIERVKGGAMHYSIQYDENSRKYHIRLIAPSMKYNEFVEANAELYSLLQGETARTDGGKIIWDDYFEMPTKALQLFLKSQANSIIPDERTRRIRLFGSKAEQKRALERLLKLLSKVRSQRHEVIVPRGSMHSLVNSRFETIQKDMGVNKVSFDLLNSKIIVRGTNEECSEIQNLVDSLNSLTTYKSGCCEICHLLPDDPKILACLHVYCTPCLRMAFRSASHGPLRCIAVTNSLSNDNSGQCLDHIPFIDEILPPPERDRLLLSSFLAYVRDSQELFICPSIDCKAVYRTGRQGLNLHCSWCGTEICSFCQTLAHIGLSCSDMEGRNSSY